MNDDDDPAAELVEEGEDALEEGDYERALDCFDRALKEDPDHWGAGLDRAETLHLLWRTQEALGAVQALHPPDDEEDDADRADLEARIREAAGDLRGADRMLEEANHLDPVEFPLPIRTTDAEFRSILDEAVATLPPVIRDAVAAVPVLVEAKPTPEMAERAPHITPEVLGLFVGTPVGEKLQGSGGYPDVVLLFRRNLERAGDTREEVAEEIRITLLHEYGHYLGFDEDELDELGLG
ncbi:MAG TPA: metallopeptidase family protein [Candidatus Eisenbacteria bacterium]